MRRTLNDVAALSTLHAFWLGQSMQSVAESFADALLRTLHADFVYVRLPGHTEHEPTIETTRTQRGPMEAQAAGDVGRWLSHEPAYDDRERSSMSGHLGNLPISVAMASVGHISGESGIVAAGAQREGFPSEYDRLLVRIGTNQLVLSLRAAEAEAARSELAAFRERQRLARELHDSVAQALYGIGLATQTARDLVPPELLTVREPLEYIQKLAEGSIAEMRALIFDLRPESLGKEGLIVALARQATVLRARYGIAVQEELTSEPHTSIEAKQALYRIAQEALRNIAKHSAAKNVQLQLLVRSDLVTMVIGDDGVGFDSGKDFPGHLGLQSMRERALEVGGELNILSTAGGGAVITVRLPVPSLDR